MNAPGVNQEWGDSYLFQIGMLKSLDQERDTFHSDGDVGFMSSDAGLTLGTITAMRLAPFTMQTAMAPNYFLFLFTFLYLRLL